VWRVGLTDAIKCGLSVVSGWLWVVIPGLEKRCSLCLSKAANGPSTQMFGGNGTVGQPGVFFALFILGESLRSWRLCVLFFNAEAGEFRREFEFGAP
jgi:hypothetical protein